MSLALSKMRLAQKAPSYLAVSYYMVIMLLLLLLLLLFFLVHSLSVFWPTCPLARELARRLSLMNHVLHSWSHCWVREGKKWIFASRKQIIEFMTISLHGMRWRGGGGGVFQCAAISSVFFLCGVTDTPEGLKDSLQVNSTWFGSSQRGTQSVL